MLTSLREGFDGVGEYLRWAVKANVRTLGYLEAEFYAQRVTKRIELQWLIGEQVTNRDLDAGRAQGFRDDLALDVGDATNRAYRFFREYVSEYTDDQTPEVEMNGGTVAFRPALTRTEQRQMRTLARAREGFSDRSELAAWERDMQDATYGEFSECPDYPIWRSPWSWECGLMLSNVGETTAARDIYLLQSVFPACIRGVRQLRVAADEEVTDSHSEMEDLDA